MIYKHCLYLLIIISFGNSFAQNNQILYDFDHLPQTLLLNPGAEVDYDKHFGVPFLSNIFLKAGATNKNITYNNILTDTDLNSDILRNVFDQNLSKDDYFLINQQIELISAGFRLKNPDYYLSFGIIQKVDGFSLYPKDLANLYYNGNDQDRDGLPETNDEFNFDQANFVGELLGIFHVGLSKNINNKLTIGARLKFLSGALNLNVTNTTGVYHLDNTILGGHEHIFSNMNINLNTSGLLNSEGQNILGGFSEQLKGMFFMNGNFGVGFDLGLTYHATDKIIVTASLLDLDYINYSNKVVKYENFEDNFTLLDEDYFDPIEGDESNYWDDKLDIYYDNGEIPIDTLQTGYSITHSPKLNTSVKYQLKKGSSKTYNSVFPDARFVTPVQKVLITEIGLQTYVDFRPNKVLWAITPFISKEINNYLTAKLTYTYDQFSAKNIGLGFSTHIRDFNLYATADNLLALSKLKDSNYQSFQFGMNFIFD
ncbi:MAG: hypothetical protein GQ552_06885 [Flavobacteriaceae bacterium]|nr:hypothetical protein [Flavobacteriaceae bacterium]